MTEQQVELQLRTWFREEVPASETAPVALRAAILSIPDAAARPAAVVRLHRARRRLILLAVAATVVLAIAAIQLLGWGSPTPSPSPSLPVTTLASPIAKASWTSSGDMRTARKWATATLLDDGRVLVAGGESGFERDAFASAELYDPVTGTWSETGTMSTARYLHTATLLLNGKVLVVGGTSTRPRTGSPGQTTSFDTESAELYDPSTGTWTATGSLAVGRSSHTATLLQDGRVLVVGATDTTEIYDPDSGTWKKGPNLQPAREQLTATLLRDGRVLVASGFNEATQNQNALAMRAAELFDPATGTFQKTGSLADRRAQAAAILLVDGRVLLVGGDDFYSDVFAPPTRSELYDPTSGSWSDSGPIVTARFNETLVALRDGSILMLGGNQRLDRQDSKAIGSAERYTPATGTWTQEASMLTARFGHTATLLANGTVLVTGGAALEDGRALASTVIFDPEAPQ